MARKKLIQHRSLGEEVYRRLLRQLLDGRFPAGSRLREETLCAELGVSRTPLREALTRLVSEGILEQQPRRGCLVRRLPEGEIVELLDCRKLLECLIVNEWSDRLDLAALRDLRDRLAAGDPAEVKTFRDAVLAADEELHQLIFAAAANRFIIAQLRHLQLLCRPYRVLRCAESADLEAIRGERLRVIDALLAHDLAAACAGLAEHFDRCRRFYLEPGVDSW